MALIIKYNVSCSSRLHFRKDFAAAFILSLFVIHSIRAADTPTKPLAASVTESDASASVGDWPQWRGGDRDGVSKETGLPKQWPKGGPPLAWKANGIGGGMGGVSIAAGRVYVCGDSGDAACLFALNEADGKLLWKAKVGRGGVVGASGQSHPGPRGSPTVDGQRIYVLTQYGELSCISTYGKELWHVDLVQEYGGRMPTWAYSESPLVDGDKVICTPGSSKGTMLALNKQSGKFLWLSKEWTEEPQYSSAIVATIGGVRQYIQQTAPSVAGVAADSGKLLWKASRSEGKIAIATPIEKDGMVYVAAGYGVGCHLFKVTPPAAAGGKFSVQKVYDNRNMKNHHGGVILFGDYVYGSNDPGLLVCMDFKTGKVAWSNRSVGKGSIAIADGMIYLRSETPPGTMALVEATPQAYKQISTFTPPAGSGQPTWPHPVIANGRLYLRDQDVLLTYDIKVK
ncbi:MAG TPA: PQQ-binding-like beta-propeller repeat protein [Humisphaera sp.]|nr:PQQ-binding-like beta-propeller repeat protein [Humisphaera sp.]